MNTRDQYILDMRGDTLGFVSETSSAEERFQNKTIRPVLKLQNELLIDVFKNHVNKYKNEFYTYPTDKKLHYIENTIQKDIKFRNALKGILIGLFTIEEYADYIQNSSALNKRMMNLLIERLKSQIQLFEHHQ